MSSDLSAQESRRAFGAATCVVAVLLIAGGVGFRAVQAWQGKSFESMAISSTALEMFPMSLDEWSGQKDVLPPELASATDTDAQLFRTYVRAGAGAINLFIGYGGHVRDLAPHRPEVCYPGAGWNLQASEDGEITLAEELPLRYRVYRFEKNSFTREQAVIMSFYVVNGHFVRDLSDLAPLAKASDNYYARVQLTAGASMFGDEPKTHLKEFALLAAPAVKSLLENAVKQSG